MTDLSPAQVSAATGISISVIYEWIRKGDLVAYRTPGRQLRVEPHELAAFRDRNRVEPRRVRAYDPPVAIRSRPGEAFLAKLESIEGGAA